MKDCNIFAYTETEYKDYPGFISINRKGGKIVFAVRSPESGGAKMAECELPADAAQDLTFKLAALFTGNA